MYKLILYDAGRRNADELLGRIAIFDTLLRLQTGRVDRQLIMFFAQTCLSVLEIIDLVAIGVGLGHLCKIQQANQACQHDQNNRVADRSDCSTLLTKARGVLAARGIALPANRQ